MARDLFLLCFVTVASCAAGAGSSDATRDVENSCSSDKTQFIQVSLNAIHVNATEEVAVEQKDLGSDLEDEAEVEFSDENFITFGSPPQPDTRLMSLREWMKAALSELPDRHLEAKYSPGEWDYACHAPKIAETASVSRNTTASVSRIPHHMHFVLFEERASWINTTDPSRLISKGSPAYNQLEGIEQLLIENMRYTIARHNMKSIHFMDDKSCRHATGKYSKRFREIYDGEADLRFKSDICRIAALFWEGGYYFDDDMLTYQPLSVHDNTELAAVLGVNGKSMFQSFLASAPCHPTLARNIELLLEARTYPIPQYIQKALNVDNGLLGPITLKLAWDEINASNTQLFHEVNYNPASEIYQAPYRGKGYDCGFVVIDESSKTINFCSRL